MGPLGTARAALLCTVAAALPLGTPVLAQDGGDGATRLQRIVKGAGSDKVAVETPQAVTIVEQRDIDQEQPVTVGDIFKQIPGATTSGSERVLGESFNIRGIGAGEAQADEGRLIVNVDGVDKNYQQYRLGGFFSDPELYKRVEVLRGPASSTLYGSGALAGTVLFVTKDPSDFLRDGETIAVRQKVGFETNSNTLVSATSFAWRASESAEFLLTGNFRRGQDYETGNGSTIDADFEAFSGLAKGVFHFGAGDEQSLKLSYQRWQTDAENQQYAQTVNSTGFGRVDREVTDEQMVIAYENPASDNPWIDLKAQVSYSNTLNRERNATVFFFGPGPGTQFFPDADFQYETWQAKIENTIEMQGADWENYLTIGFQYTHLDRQLALRDTGAQPEGIDEKFGIYVQNEFIWNEKLTLIPGLRIDWRELTPDESVVTGFVTPPSSVDDNAISPKLAAIYKFNEHFSVFGSYAHTERFATLDEEFDYRTGFVQGNLEKERSDNFEVGFAVSRFDIFEAGDAFQLKTTAFHNDIKDYIYRNPVARTASPRAGRPFPGPGSAFINIGDVRLYGIEVEMAYDSSRWFASAGASLIRGEDGGRVLSASGNLNTVPPDELFVTLGYKIPEYDMSFGWSGRFVDAQDHVFGTRNARQPSDGFATHALFFNWLPQEGQFAGLEFRASAEKIFDKQYKEFLSNDPGKGLTFKVSVAKRFGG